MAEELTFLPAGVTSGGITFHTGDWQIEALDLGVPGVRDELVSSADADGAVPYRVGKREAVEWSARIRLVKQPSKDAALGKLRELEGALASAEAAAARGVVDPGVDAARLVWRPEGATSAGVLPLIRAEITERPIEVTGDSAGWFLDMPVITIGGLRDPFVWGDLTEVASGTASGAPLAQILGLPAIGGSVAPWVKVTVEETASRDRNQLFAGLEVPSQAGSPSGASLVVPPSNMDTSGYSGTVSGGRLTCTSSEWVGAAAYTDFHLGSYRVIAALVKGAGSIRFRWGTVGGAYTLNVPQSPDNGTFRDLDLGAIDVSREQGGMWAGVLETSGTVSLAGLILVPMDTWVSAETPPGSSGLGTKVVDGNLTGSGSLSGSALTLPSGQSWAVTGTWTKQPGYVQRTAVSEGTVQAALAGTSNYSGVQVSAEVFPQTVNPGTFAHTGVLLRYVNASNFVSAVLVGWNGVYYVLSLGATVGGVQIPLYGVDQGLTDPGRVSPGRWVKIVCSIDTQGRWQLAFGQGAPLSGDPVASERLVAAGQHPALASGGALASGKVGLIDRWPAATAATRNFRSFVAHGTTLSQEPMLPSGKSLEITPAGMVTVDGDRRRVSHRGGMFQPPPDQTSRLLVGTRRFAGMASTEAEGKTDNQRITVHARRRWLQVP